MRHPLKIFFINIFAFVVSLHYGLIIYSESTYLTKYLGQDNIWIVYSTAAFLTILLTFSVTKILKLVSITTITKISLFIAFLNLLLIPYYTSASSVTISVVIYNLFAELLFLLPSIMLEHFSKTSNTGELRGLFLCSQNLGFLVAPFLTSIIIETYNLETIFTFSGIALFIGLLIIQFFFRKEEFNKISETSKNLTQSFQKIFNDPNIRNIFIAEIGLYSFYCGLSIYLPFKMGEVGIPITEYLGILLPLALTTFIFIPPLLGHLEDDFRNEKPILVSSFIGLIFILVIFSFTTTNSLIYWAILIFTSRIFASAAETSISSYFFKHVKEEDTGVISLFTASQNFAYLVATPIFGLIIMKYFGLKILFLSVSLFLCFVLVFISNIKQNHIYEHNRKQRLIRNKAQTKANA